MGQAGRRLLRREGCHCLGNNRIGGANRMTDINVEAITLPYEAAESIAIAFLKRQLVWMEEECAKPPLFEEDRTELIKDITAVRRVLWWMTGDFSYDDQK
jgi:hypothetical protein